MKEFIKLSTFLMLLVMMTGCARELPEKTLTDKETKTVEDKLEIWSYYEGWDLVAEQFKKEYGKDIEIEVKVFQNKEYVDAYLEGLASGEGPDVMIIDSLQMGQFNTLDAFEDLQSAPYNIDRYKDDFSRGAWQSGMDFREEKMIAVMMANAPKVTFYRADIMREHGFPDDPQELAEFMEKPENYLAIAESLKKDDIYIAQWALDPLAITMSAIPYFDKEYNFVMNNKAFNKGIDMCKTFKAKNLLTYKDVWLEEGQELIRNNQMAMLYFGTWGSNQIESWVPEQKGLWRVTSLPFGVNAISNGTLMAIPANSSNKEVAWDFIEQYVFGDLMPNTTGSIPCYIPKQLEFYQEEGENAFLGGQKEQQFYADLLKKCKYIHSTSLDEKALTIINQQMIRGLNAGYSNDVIIANIQYEIDKQLEDEKDILMK